MKLVGLVGSNADQSYNRMLLQFMKEEFSDLFELELLEINQVPLFNQSDDQTDSEPVQYLNRKIKEADAVIIATPEHNRTIPPALKSVIEWLSFKVHPFEDKPVLVVGASYYDQGTSRAQLHLRQILESPGVGAFTFPGNEFLLGNATTAFDTEGRLTDEGTVKFLRSVLVKFIRYINILNGIEGKEVVVDTPEDLYATGVSETTVEGLDMYANDWVEQAAEKTNAVSGDTYVQLNRGILTVDQIDHLMNSMPMEITYADDNNQFIYYNYHLEEGEMLADRHPSQVGNPLAECHPERALKGVEWVVKQLRSGAMDVFRVKAPNADPKKFVVHNYQAMHDEDGKYLGINEYIHDIQPIVDWYLEQTGQELVGGKPDAVSGATANDLDADAPVKNAEADAVSGATANDTKANAPVQNVEADAVSGASENA